MRKSSTLVVKNKRGTTVIHKNKRGNVKAVKTTRKANTRNNSVRVKSKGRR